MYCYITNPKELYMKKTINLLSLIILSSCIGIQSAEQQNIANLRFDLAIKYKLYFDNAVENQDIDTITALLTSEVDQHEDFRNSYPLAMKLYRILTDDSPGEDFTIEARYIPFESIINVARALAEEGGNYRFLKNMPRS